MGILTNQPDLCSAEGRRPRHDGGPLPAAPVFPPAAADPEETAAAPPDIASADDRACLGAVTLEVQRNGASFERCVACGTECRFDLTDHPLFGFQTCEFAKKEGGHSCLPNT